MANTIPNFATLTENLPPQEKTNITNLCNTVQIKHRSAAQTRSETDYQQFVTAKTAAEDGISTYINRINADQNADRSNVNNLYILQISLMRTYPLNDEQIKPRGSSHRSVNLVQLATPIRKFDGNTAAYHPKLYLLTIDNAKRRENLPDAEATQLIALTCKEATSAANWTQTVATHQQSLLEDYAAYCKAFLARFTGAASAEQKVELQRSLYQRDREPVLSFLDRVKNAVYILNDDAPKDPLLTDEQQKRITDLHNNSTIKEKFFAGLTPTIRSIVIIADKHAGTLEDITKAAVNAETAQNTQSTNFQPLTTAITARESLYSTTTPEFPISALTQNLSALRFPRSTRSRGFSGRNNRSRGRGYRQSQQENRTCLYCHNKGHIVRDCINKQRDRERGVFQEQRPQQQQPFQQQRGRGRFRSNRGSSYRGGYRGRFRPNFYNQRSANAIEYEDEPNNGNEEHQQDSQPTRNVENINTQPQPDKTFLYRQ